MVVQGVGNHSDVERLRADPLLAITSSPARGQAAAGQALASQPTLARLLDILAGADNQVIIDGAAMQLAGQRLRAANHGRRRRRITIDIDGLPLLAHGEQPGSAYNGHVGERVYDPLVAPCAETGDLLGARLTELVAAARSHLAETVQVRLGAGFCDGATLDALDAEGVGSTVRLRSNRRLERLFDPHRTPSPGPPRSGRASGPWRRRMRPRRGPASAAWSWWSRSTRRSWSGTASSWSPSCRRARMAGIAGSAATAARAAFARKQVGQMIPFEPPRVADGITLGGAIATGLPGPCRPRAGAARDLVLGTRLIDGRGEPIRFGGDGIKNVAGYDVSRVVTAGQGTLGVLGDVSIKFLPGPERKRRSGWGNTKPAGLPRSRRPPAPECRSVARPKTVNACTCESPARNSPQTPDWSALGGIADEDPGAFWTARRDHTLSLFTGDGPPLWRLPLPPLAGTPELPGTRPADWAGQQQWPDTHATAGTGFAKASRRGDDTTLCRSGDGNSEMLQPLSPLGAAPPPATQAGVRCGTHPQQGAALRRSLTPTRPESEPSGLPMQTWLPDAINDTPEGQEGDRILHKCTHCGLCLATWPITHWWGNELDSVGGRIDRLKQVLEGQAAIGTTQMHPDRCPTCSNCESTYSSGVEYGRLLDIGRSSVGGQLPRPGQPTLLRRLLGVVLPRRRLFTALLPPGHTVRPLIPGSLRGEIPPRPPPSAWPRQQRQRYMLMFEGCAQPALESTIDLVTTRLLGCLGIDALRTNGSVCCGGIDQHLGHPDSADEHVRANIDACWPEIETGAEAAVVNASGCGVRFKDYGHILRDNPGCADKAQRVAYLAVDPVELLLNESSGCGRRITPHRRSRSSRPALCNTLRNNEAVSRHCCAGSVSNSRRCCSRRWPKGLRNNKLNALGPGKTGSHCHGQHRLPDPTERGLGRTCEALAGTAGGETNP